MPEKMTETGKIAAVICELDPLHFGHRALFRRAKEEAEALICVLSGNFVQRGGPAMLDKWSRAQLALENGADLVVELPLPWACAGAERFAAGGVALAGAFGCVDILTFGSETADAALLDRAAEALLSEEFSQRLRALPEEGEPFAKRREKALAQMLGPEILPVLRSPNATLGVEYLKAIKAQGLSLTPLVFPRRGANHNETAQEGQLRSAGELRELVKKGRPIGGLAPESTAALVEKLTAQGRCPADISFLERAMLCKLRAMAPEDFAALPDVSEGLENRLYQASRQAGSLEEFFALAKSKRTSHARIRRLAVCAFLGVTNALPALPPYLRVLGMDQKGAQVLGAAKPSLPLVTRPADLHALNDTAKEMFLLEARADDLYGLACPVPTPCGRDYTERLLRPLG